MQLNQLLVNTYVHIDSGSLRAIDTAIKLIMNMSKIDGSLVKKSEVSVNTGVDGVLVTLHERA